MGGPFCETTGNGNNGITGPMYAKESDTGELFLQRTVGIEVQNCAPKT